MTKLLILALPFLLNAEAQAQAQKISERTAGSPAAAGDMIPISRGTSNLRLDAADFCMTEGCAVKATGASSFATLSAEMMTNPGFTGDLSGWTGTNWSHSSNRALHAAGSTAALSQNVSVTNGTWYQITMTFPTGVVGTAGSIDVALGAQSVRTAAINPAGSSQATSEFLLILANTTGSVALTATPTTDFNGALDFFGMKAFVGEVPVVLDMKDISGTSFGAVRGGPDFPASSNIFWGYDAGRYALGYGESIGIGQLALRNVGNPGFGGYRNTMVGAYAGLNITNGIENVGIGGNALQTNTNGIRNVAVGRQALWALRTGDYNVALGYAAGLSTLYGNWNTYLGTGSGQSASATAAVPGGNFGNVFVGVNSGFNYNGVGGASVTTATYATIVGTQSGFCTSTQRVNAAVYGALACVDSDNTAVIGNAATTDVILGQGTSTPGPFARLLADRVRVKDGTRALPSLSFATEPDSGLYVVGAGEVGFSVNDTLGYSFAQAGAGHRWYVANVEKMRLNGTVFFNLDPSYQVTWGSALGSSDVSIGRGTSPTRFIVYGSASEKFSVSTTRTTSDVAATWLRVGSNTSTYVKAGGGIYSTVTSVGNVTTGEDDLHSYTLPTNAVDNADGRGSFHLVTYGTFAATANNKRVRVRFGGTLLFDTGALATSTAAEWSITCEVLHVGSNAQRGGCTWTSDDATLREDVDYAEPAEAVSGTIVFKVTGDATATDDIIAKFSRIDWLPAAN
jgi:hypothetical protein